MDNRNNPVPDRLPVPEPFWLAAPCPEWCTGRHASHDAIEDRRHVGEDLTTVLTAEDGMITPGTFPVAAEPRAAEACLMQHYREAEPVVWFSLGDNAGQEFRMTLAEAEQVAADMLALVARARGGAR